MQDLMPPINTPDSAFHDGDPTTGQLGTIITALWLNNVQSATRDVQLEIKNVLAKAGIQPDPKKTNQLAEAISQIIGSGNYASTAYVDNGLNKKIDKANISGVKGNDNDKVPSLNLFTTEIGKLAALGYSYSKIESDGRYQPKGNYAPAGDYATNASLNSGLNEKVNKTNGEILGRLGIKANDDYPYLNLVGASGALTTLQANVSDAANMITIVNRDNAGTAKNTVRIPNRTGTAMLVGDYGWGGKGEVLTYNENSYVAYIKNINLNTSVFRNSAQDSKYHYQHAAVAYFKVHDTYTAISADYSGKGLIAIGGNATTFYEYRVYTDRNTKIDRNGNLKVSGSSDASTDFPVGSPIPWPQATAPSGFLVCNGQSFNKTTYPLLASAYPSGVLPDLRAEFIRGLDAGRNVDGARTVLSAQGDAIRDITGKIQGINMTGDGVFGNRELLYTSASPHGGGKDQYGMTLKASNVVPTANENRPRNIAFLYIVRAA